MQSPPDTPDRPKAIDDAVAAYKRSRDAMKDLGIALQQLRSFRTQVKQSAAAIAQQRLKWLVRVKQPLLLCSQVQRSGGTLVARLFDGHPQCLAHPYELTWGKPRKWHWPQLDLSPAVTADDLLAQVHEDWPRRFAISGYEKYSPATRHAGDEAPPRYPFIFDLELQRAAFATVLKGIANRTQRDVFNAYFTSLFNAWLDYQNLYGTPKQWVTAFVPKLAMTPGAVGQFFEDYPDGLFVTIVRDPRGWLASARRHVEPAKGHASVDEWLASTEASVHAHATNPARVVVVIFEDLVSRTEAVMRSLCQRMNIAFDSVLLRPTYNSMAVLSDSSYTPSVGIDPQVTERFRDVLSASELAAIEETAMPRFNDVRSRFGLGV